MFSGRRMDPQKLKCDKGPVSRVWASGALARSGGLSQDLVLTSSQHSAQPKPFCAVQMRRPLATCVYFNLNE